jgi:hypothetical protein
MLSTAMMMSKLYRLSMALEFNEIIGTISTLSENCLGEKVSDCRQEVTFVP